MTALRARTDARSPSSRIARAALLASVLAFAACSRSPVEWAAQQSVQPPPGDVVLAVDGTVHADSLAALAARVATQPSACAGSARVATAGSVLHAVWWAARPDSGANLVAARSSDGGQSWSAPAMVDSTDHGGTGCRRDPPSIAADAGSGYVHVAYGMTAAEGPGVFFAHSMDGGRTFHTPVPILYGERFGRTSIAAAGDVVAVAFEDPNSRTPAIGLALSGTMGHIFEHRILPVSDENGAATGPLVAVQGRRIAVAWHEASARAGGTILRVRTGTIR